MFPAFLSFWVVLFILWQSGGLLFDLSTRIKLLALEMLSEQIYLTCLLIWRWFLVKLSN